MRRLIFYTRGDASWGMGHLHRVSWLVETLQVQHIAKAPVTIVRCLDTAEARNFWRQRLPQFKAQCDVEYISTPDLRLPANGLSAGDIVVADWLDNDIEQIRLALRAGARVVLLDEYGPAQGEADLVINTLLAPLVSGSAVIGRARVWSGVEYVQLPSIVATLRQAAEAAQQEIAMQLVAPATWREEVHAVLVSFGGIARREATQSALEALAHAGFNGRVICIPAPDGLRVPPGLKVDLHPAGFEFHGMLAACDLAVVAGGLTLYEAACLGVPPVVVSIKSGAPGRELHQLETARKLEQAGCCVSAGLLAQIVPAQLGLLLGGLIMDAPRRKRMTARGMGLVDGHGLERTLDRILFKP